ncbi:MAG: hypothetical protein ABSB76_39640 [Streptosporangiaceae bacterium]|jgi:hypothetical protein
MILRHLRLVMALLFLVLVAMGASQGVSQAATAVAPAPSGQLGIKLLQVPTSEANDPRALEYIIDRLAPGTVIHREFSVGNPGSVPLHVTVYPAAATISNGGFHFDAGRIQNGMTTWVSVSQGALTLAPHGNATLVVTVAVPRNAPSGSQYGMIWAQVSSSGAGNVTLVSRVGIRLYLSIGQGGAPPSDFTLGTPAASRTSAGIPVIRVPVDDTGGLALDVRGTVQLSGGPGGISAGPFDASTIVTLAPGQSAPALFRLNSSLPNGPWQVTFTMVSGLLTRTAKATLDFSGAPATAAHTSKFPVVPVAAAVAALILLALAATLITRSRRTRIMRARHV